MTREKDGRGGKRDGSGRKKLRAVRKGINISLPEWLIYLLDRKSKADNLSKSKLVEIALIGQFDFQKTGRQDGNDSDSPKSDE